MTGGIGRVTDVLTRHFREEFGWKVYSIYGREAANGCELAQLDGEVCLRLHDRWGLRKDVRGNIPRAAEFLNANAIDVLIVQTSMDVAAKLYGHVNCRIVSCLHFEPGRDEWRWKGLKGFVRNPLMHWLTVRAYRSAVKCSDRVVVLSDSYVPMYASYAGILGTDSICSIPNPLSFKTEYPEHNDGGKSVPGHGCEKRNVVLVVARMEEVQKRIGLVLRVWKRMGDAVPSVAGSDKWTLKIVGDGPDLGYYKSLAESLGLENVVFTGRQNPEPFYREAKIFLMTSSFEGFPMTLVEAQQYGCVPVVYDSFAALKDVVTDGRNGLVIENGDENGFVDAVLGLMRNECTRRFMADNSVMDCRRYSAESIGEIWRKMLTQHRHS